MTDNNIFAFPTAVRDENSGRRLLPAKLVEARTAALLNQSELAALVCVSRQAISSYEQGVKSPEPDTMASIARMLEQPINFFVTEPAPNFGPLSVNFFRKVGVDTKRRNMSCDVHAKWLASAAYSFDELVNFPPVDIPSFEPKDEGESKYSDEEIENIAEEVREHFGLGLGPISNVVRLMEKFGVVICRLEMKDEKVEAFSFWSGAKPFVFLASDKASGARARFDAAHELGHLVLHRWVGSDEIEDKARLKIIEKEANQFASAFLLPRKSFPNEVFSSRLASFLDLKARWKVSIQAMVYRCKTLGIFDEQQITNLNKQISFKKWRTKEPMDGPEGLPIEQPLLLGKIARLVFENSQMKQDEIVNSLGFSRSTIERLLGLETGALSRPPEPDFEPSFK